MLTEAARATLEVPTRRQVLSRQALTMLAISPGVVRARLAAGRWRAHGLAIVLHNGPLTRDQQWRVALINSGPRAMWTAFTAAEHHGLRGWEREEVHILVPINASSPTPCGVPIKLHRSRLWSAPSDNTRVRVQPAADSLLRAAGSLDSPRWACGILAASVQQKVVSAGALSAGLERTTRIKHRAVLLAAMADIAGGAQALSEIDFARLCRANGLPEPERQTVRRDESGRRRYLDVTWRRADGKLVVVEIDGALHLNQKNWWSDQLRQNELVLGDAMVLRYPSVIVRIEPALVIDQLRRALFLI